MINDYQPALVCIVETHMQKEEEIQILKMKCDNESERIIEEDNESERIIEEEVKKKFQEVIRKANQIESITDEMVKKAIAKLKNKRARDR